jgi:hypothetical protein
MYTKVIVERLLTAREFEVSGDGDMRNLFSASVVGEIYTHSMAMYSLQS